MKKQTNSIYPLIIYIPALVICLGLVLAVFFWVVPQITPQDNYKIYQEQCTNQTIEEPYPFSDYMPIDCPIITLNVSCYDHNGNEIIGSKCISKSSITGADKCYHIMNTSINAAKDYLGYQAISLTHFYDENWTSLREYYYYEGRIGGPLPIKNIYTKEVCEQVEINDPICSDLKVHNESPGGCASINNKDIKEKWIEKTCACTDDCMYVLADEPCFKNCKNFKCGSYTVVKS